jgi:hypothetical protein
VAGGRGEAATYEAPDDEEAQIAKEAQRSALLEDEGGDEEDVAYVNAEQENIDITIEVRDEVYGGSIAC